MMDEDAKTMDFRLNTRLSLLMVSLLAPVVGASAATLTLDNQDPAAVYLIPDAKLIQEREGVKIAGQSYRYFVLQLADNLQYEGYITRCADDDADKLNEQARRQLNRCTEQVIDDLDRLMEKTANLTFDYGGTQNVYRGEEHSTPYYYYSFARVAHYYQTEDGRHPLYGLVYRCKQPASDAHREQEPDATETTQPPAEVERFIALAKNRCANVLKPR
ncbi:MULTISPECIES: hypothetical protein [Serratia]|uniref:hypothetical protein n=1 Tax=Serratia TaxID=613 RepID=UPI00066994A4|nr:MULTISPECIES: hypothetical protein [Serratia]MDI6930191.1 hypothetical protein [Serratia sp. Se-PFBMAAmG]ASL83029.1 hypothetical protein BVG95_09000 [Serratia marcescens]ASM21589.1 hypothetical protein BVG92_09005 [Serratia marcescens]ASM26362.1 hypothetical protein BVG89_09005 [Serratia marcescens]ASM31138.1 hypothetical protein BVG84_09025 [Serratia marcescens]